MHCKFSENVLGPLSENLQCVLIVNFSFIALGPVVGWLVNKVNLFLIGRMLWYY